MGGQHLPADQNKDKSNAAKTQSTETTKKGQVCFFSFHSTNLSFNIIQETCP